MQEGDARTQRKQERFWDGAQRLVWKRDCRKLWSGLGNNNGKTNLLLEARNERNRSPQPLERISKSKKSPRFRMRKRIVCEIQARERRGLWAGCGFRRN